MSLATRYKIAKQKLLNNVDICEENRILWKDFFDFQERKLKRRNGLSELDEGCYKTLIGYVYRLPTVNSWFKNKPWKEISKEDIRQVYDDLEDGVIKTSKGEKYQDRAAYYNKILKSKPFKMVGKAELAKEVIEYYETPDAEVRYITQETFLVMTSVLSKPEHLLLFWLAWDIGENVGALVKLQKRDFFRQTNVDSGKPEYIVNLPKEKIKRTRKARKEPTLYDETVQFLDMVLAKLDEDDLVFGFGHARAIQIISGVVKRTGAKTMPDGEGLACPQFMVQPE